MYTQSSASDKDISVNGLFLDAATFHAILCGRSKDIMLISYRISFVPHIVKSVNYIYVKTLALLLKRLVFNQKAIAKIGLKRMSPLETYL